ncbi:MAG: fluoride efflux transporter CrcB [Coprobacter sp.]|jgi:protein CrcB|uniref:fluoride efflux transporter CrcB n=1 Tax=Barnesiella propionica TaxID=2981781 RepID=UPI000D78D123|nr:fluoride efflux transporter CrcB [Barnesiella propionica]MBO1734748.1 fluoride efflux transporter CrcB [Barnesiella sp. GGCC_0306]MBS7040696.1 fluoride efflux transporter CrcB [Bacteroidales bacterium]MCU6768238.1 fluoride efflux transporter CrcB [Barnesiella propionica]PWM92457.1 MAG: fluoride efflux transporter CrcB [Coprobacter sp.]
MDKLLYVILGGAIGSGFRYGVSVWMQSFSISFPFAILTVNVTGSFFIGLCGAITEIFHVPLYVKLFLFTGIFGGFTTFSTYTLDTLLIIKAGDYKMALINILANNILGIIAVFCGFFIGKYGINLIKA